MNPTRRQLIAVGTLLLCVITPSQAGILADLNQMFMSNATSAGTMQSRDRVGVFGGSFEMRSPIKSVNLIGFDPPRMNAGCGGIDLYGGSFTFLSGQDLIKVFRSVASNAAGLAFKAAIKAISPSLDALISEFQALMQNMNNLAKNSCNLAHLIVDPSEKAIGDAVHGDGNVGGTLDSFFTDNMASLTEYTKDANSYFRKQGVVNPRTGNQVAKAAVASGASGILGLAGLGNIDGSGDDASNPNSLNNRLIFSLLGYDVAGLPCGSENEDGAATTTQNVAPNNLGRISCHGPALITLNDLVKGGGIGSEEPDVPLKLYRCLNPNGSDTTDGGFDVQICTQMKRDDFNYQGIRGWVNTMLFGTGSVTGAASTVTPGSIVGKFNSGTSFQFDATQIGFIKQGGSRLIGLLSRVNNPDARFAIAYRLGTNLTECVAAKVGEALYLAANNVQTDNSYVLTEDQKDRIKQLRGDFLKMKNQCLHDDTVAKIVVELNESAKLANTTRR